MNKEHWFEFVREFITPNDKEEIESVIDNPAEDRKMNFVECFDCKIPFLVIEKFEKAREISCPHCGCKLKIKFYKNGGICIRRVL